MHVFLVLDVLIINAFVDVITISIVNKEQDALMDSVFRVKIFFWITWKKCHKKLSCRQSFFKIDEKDNNLIYFFQVVQVINALVMKFSDHVHLHVNQVASNEIMLAQLNVYLVDANAIMALFVIVLAIVFHLINASKIIIMFICVLILKDYINLYR